MTRSMRRSNSREPSQTPEAGNTATPNATNSPGASDSSDASKILSSEQINDDLTAMGVEGKEIARELHHADVLRAMFYNSNAQFDERLPHLSGEWAVPDYTDEEGLDILRSLRRHCQETESITPVLEAELPMNMRLATFREAGLIGSSEEYEDGSSDVEMEDPSHTVKAAGNKQRHPFKIVRRIDRKTYPAHGTPASDRLRYNDSDRNIGSLAKSQGVVSTSFEYIGAHETIVPKSLLTTEERPASVRGLIGDARVPVQTEEDIDTYLAGREAAYAQESRGLEAEAKADTAAKWALMKKQAKTIAPPKKITPAPKEPRAKGKLRRSARNRHDSAVPTPNSTTPPLEEQSAASDSKTSDQHFRRFSKLPIRDPKDDNESSTSDNVVSARTPTTSDDVEADSTANDGNERSASMVKTLPPFIEGSHAGVMMTRAQKRKRGVSDDLPRAVIHQDADDQSTKRARVLPIGDAIDHGQQEPSGASAEVIQEGTEAADIADAPAVPTGKPSLSTFASGRKRDGSGRFQSNKNTVLGKSGGAKVSKANSKKK